MASIRLLFFLCILTGLAACSADALAQTDEPSAEGLEQPVSFSAKDSLVINFADSTTQSRLNGEAAVSSGETEITAPTITLGLESKRMEASSLRQDSGRVQLPTFTQGSESFQGETFAYNLRTQKGRIVEAQTAFEDGQVGGEVIKQPSDSVIYVKGATYTTCPCKDDPQYHLRANKMKILNKKWIFTGPIHLRLYNIPLPVWLPFGFLPAQATRRSGFLPPSYGEDQRGFFLRNWGWYWAINPYMDFQVQFGIWTKGSWQIAPRFRYRKRYRYSGNLSVDWIRNRRGEQADPTFTVVDTRSLRWNHNQTINPSTRFSADVNLSSRGYLRTISRDYDDRVRQNVQSSINLNKRWSDQGRSLSLTARQSQHLADGRATLMLPSLSFSQQQRRPFQHETPRPGGTRWYEKISYSYRSRASNRYEFDPRSDTTAAGVSWWNGLLSAQKYRQATGDRQRFNFQATHDLPVSASFSLNRVPFLGRIPLNLSPRFDYSEEWFIRTNRRTGVDSTNTVRRETVPGFFAFRHFNSSISANTEFYGIFPWRVGQFNGFRHVVRPSWSYTYRPDYSTDFWGYYRSYINEQGLRQEYPIVPGVPRGKQQALSFNLTNVFQGKYVSTDTTGQQHDRTIQLLTLDLNTSYNFAADSLRFSPIRLNARTRILDRFDINANASLSPYASGPNGRPISRFAWQNGNGLARLTSFRLSARTSLQGQLNMASPSPSPAGPPPPRSTAPSSFGAAGRRYGSSQSSNNRWSLNLSGHYSYSNRGSRSQQRAVLNTQFSLPITSSISVRGNTGYDFVENEVVTTSLNIHRELRCWTMGLSWVPFGRGQSFQFSIQVKSGKLRDILQLSIPQSDIQNRFGQLAR